MLLVFNRSSGEGDGRMIRTMMEVKAIDYNMDSSAGCITTLESDTYALSLPLVDWNHALDTAVKEARSYSCEIIDLSTLGAFS